VLGGVYDSGAGGCALIVERYPKKIGTEQPKAHSANASGAPLVDKQGVAMDMWTS